MDRRSFLTLIAGAPIAALAPLPSILACGLYLAPYKGNHVLLYEVGAPQYAIWRPDFKVRVQSQRPELRYGRVSIRPAIAGHASAAQDGSG